MGRKRRFSKLNAALAALALLNLAQAWAYYSASQPKTPRDIPASAEIANGRDGVHFFWQRGVLFMQLMGVNGTPKTIYRIDYR